MKLLARAKDGGPDSSVVGYWLIEIKGLVSIALLRFANGSRQAFHSHAFNSVSWVLRGRLREQHLSGREEVCRPSWRPVITRRRTFHRVISEGTSWVLTLRGPWAATWREYHPASGRYQTLTHGRVVVRQCDRLVRAPIETAMRPSLASGR